MIDNKELCRLAQTKDSFRWSLRESIARKMSSTIWGQGYIFQSEEQDIEKKFKKFAKMNTFPNLCGYIERRVSQYGRCIITINKTIGGDIMLNVPSPFYFAGLGKAFVQPQLAVIYQRFTIDQRNFIVKTTYDTKKVLNELYTISNGKEVRVFDAEAQVLKELQIERLWEHNLGFVPVVEITNLPFYQFQWNNDEFIKITDWFPAIIFEDLMISTIQNFKKEMWMCHSRIVVDSADQKVIQQITALAKKDDNIDIGDWIFETGTGSEFKPVPGNGDFTKYTSALDQLMDFYFKFCGGSRFSEGGGAQKTVAETASTRSSMIESVTSKILLRQEQLTDLLRKVLCALSDKDYWGEEEFFTFKINGNIMKDETTFIDNIQKKISMGLMSAVDAIQEIFNISKQEAEEKFEEVKAFNEEYGLDFESILGNMGGSKEEKNMNKLGEHKDSVKKGEA